MSNNTYSFVRSCYIYIYKFIISPKNMGSITPSSRWLSKMMMSDINWNCINKLAELGAGTGVITKDILRNMSVNSTLDAYEIDPDFISILNNFTDERLVVFPFSAESLSKSYDVIFSGIPFLSLDKSIGLKILESVRDNIITNDGVFILFQYTTKYETYLSCYFNFKKKRVFLNVPPAWVYVCKAKNELAS